MTETKSNPVPVGRFAPSPTGRMHLGNVATALMSWLSVRSRGGRWILRIEDLDPQRSKADYARMIEDDLDWLGLDWDEGGLDDRGPNGPYSQSRRSEIYARYLDDLRRTGYTYPCYCTRADIMSTQAPHQSDGRVVYAGTCRPDSMPVHGAALNDAEDSRPHSVRIFVPDEDINFCDRVFGRHSVNLTRHCGDFLLRRADGAWAYQLAVVVDDALMGVNEVVRGSDLLLSTAQQIYLCRRLGFDPPEYAHIPLLCNRELRRLSKRDRSLAMDELRSRYSPQQVLAFAAYAVGLVSDQSPRSLEELTSIFDWNKIPARESSIVDI